MGYLQYGVEIIWKTLIKQMYGNVTIKKTDLIWKVERKGLGRRF